MVGQAAIDRERGGREREGGREGEGGRERGVRGTEETKGREGESRNFI